MGAKISGIGTRTLVIEGVTSLHGATIDVIPDRIETGTFAMAAAMAGGDVLLRHARADHLQAALDVLAQAGAQISLEADGVRVRRNGNGIQPVDVETEPFPGFPTDLQAQFMALMTMSQGTSRIRETIFENRYMHVAELARFGADIRVEGQVATVTGVPALTGAQVMATDLRASVSLVIAGLAARGETIVNRIYHLDRGFERLEDKLSPLRRRDFAGHWLIAWRWGRWGLSGVSCPTLIRPPATFSHQGRRARAERLDPATTLLLYPSPLVGEGGRRPDEGDLLDTHPPSPCHSRAGGNPD